MAQQAQQVNISQLPPTSVLYNGDVFVVDQIGGDGYTKQITFTNFYKSLSAIILPDLYNTKVSKAGDEMTGYLTLNAAPTGALNAATKQYVDDSGSSILSTVRLGYVPLSGGTMTGHLTLNAAPTAALHAATKDYVDAAVGTQAYAVPTGAIFWFAGSTAPTGYLFCSGGEVPNGSGTVQGKTADFSALYAVLGTTYGNAGELPDLRGEFVRGWDGSAADGTNRGVDASRAFGSYQVDQVGEHNLLVRSSSYTAEFAPNYLTSKSALAAGFFKYPNNQGDGTYDSFATTNPGLAINRTENQNTQLDGLETRPRNVALLPCIKY